MCDRNVTSQDIDHELGEAIIHLCNMLARHVHIADSNSDYAQQHATDSTTASPHCIISIGIHMISSAICD